MYVGESESSRKRSDKENDMRKIICALAVLALLPVVANAKKAKTNLEGVDQAAARAQQEAQSSKISIYQIKNIPSSPEYVSFLRAKTFEIIGEEESIPLSTLKQNGIAGISWDSLSAKEQDQLEGYLSRKNGSVREIDIMSMIVLLDAQLEINPNTNKEAFHMDAKLSSGEKSGLAQTYLEEILFLQMNLKPFTRRYERGLVMKDQVLKDMHREIKQIQWYQNGQVNQTELDNLFNLIDAKEQELYNLLWDTGISYPTFWNLFEEAIKEHLLFKDQNRGGGVSYTFDDGTNLYHNGLYHEHRYTKVTL